MSAFDKLEYELYAPLTLTYSFPQFVRSLSKGESPDWQDAVHGIGIEVARAEDKHYGYSKYYWNKYGGKDRGEIPTSEQCGYKGYLKFDDNNKLNTLSPYKSDSVDVKECDKENRIGLIDTYTHIQFAFQKTQRKLQLLNSENYMKFNENCLYLYMTKTPLEKDVHNYLEWYTTIVKKQQFYFNHVFLMAFNEIYNLNMNDCSFEKHTFSEKDLACFDRLVHKLRKETTWKDGTPFSMY